MNFIVRIKRERFPRFPARMVVTLYAQWVPLHCWAPAVSLVPVTTPRERQRWSFSRGWSRHMDVRVGASGQTYMPPWEQMTPGSLHMDDICICIPLKNTSCTPNTPHVQDRSPRPRWQSEARSSRLPGVRNVLESGAGEEVICCQFVYSESREWAKKTTRSTDHWTSLQPLNNHGPFQVIKY